MTSASSMWTARMIRVLWPHRFRLLILMGLTVLLSILAMCSPLVTRAFIDNVIGLGQKDRLAPLTFWRVFLVLALPLFGYLQIRLITYVGQRFVFELRNELYDHMLDMSLRFFSKHSTGKLVNRLMGDTGKLANMLSSQTMGIISDLACSAFAVTATVALNWRLSLVIWVVIAVFLINYRIYNIKLGHMSRAFSIGYDHMAGGIQNRLTVGLAVKSFGAENREQIRFEMDSAVNTELSTTTNQTRMEFSQNSVLIQNLSRALLYFLGCAMVLQGEMTYGDVTAFTAYALQLLGPAVRFSELAQQLQEMRIALERIMEVFEERPELPSGVGWKPEQRVNGQVYFQQVNFGYSADRPVIRDFELNVKAGETIALVGPTGCGKSTILLLLMRFFDTQQGSVLLDGRNVKTFDLRALRSQFGIVLQEPLLFHISIADNIRYARSPLAMRSNVPPALRKFTILSCPFPRAMTPCWARKGCSCP